MKVCQRLATPQSLINRGNPLGFSDDVWSHAASLGERNVQPPDYLIGIVTCYLKNVVIYTLYTLLAQSLTH